MPETINLPVEEDEIIFSKVSIPNFDVASAEDGKNQLDSQILEKSIPSEMKYQSDTYQNEKDEKSVANSGTEKTKSQSVPDTVPNKATQVLKFLEETVLAGSINSISAPNALTFVEAKEEANTKYAIQANSGVNSKLPPAITQTPPTPTDLKVDIHIPITESTENTNSSEKTQIFPSNEDEVDLTAEEGKGSAVVPYCDIFKTINTPKEEQSLRETVEEIIKHQGESRPDQLPPIPMTGNYCIDSSLGQPSITACLEKPEKREPNKSEIIEEGEKLKKGVMTKILEIVGVTPKTKKDNSAEMSKSVFYDEDNIPLTEERSKIMSSTSIQSESQKVPTAVSKDKNFAPKVGPSPQGTAIENQLGNNAFLVEEVKNIDQNRKTEAQKGNQGKKDFQSKSGPKGKQKKKNNKQVEVTVENKNEKRDETSKQRAGEESKTTIELSKNAITTETVQKPVDVTAQRQPGSNVAATDSALVLDSLPKETDEKVVIDTVVETPRDTNATDKFHAEKISSKTEEIIGKAKTVVDAQLQDQKSAGNINNNRKNVDVSDELINTMKLITEENKTNLQESPKKIESKVPRKLEKGNEKKSRENCQKETSCVQEETGKTENITEELKVTPEEERQKHKGEAAGTSKLSDQILKAIPPPRRKAITGSKTEESSSDTVNKSPKELPSHEKERPQSQNNQPQSGKTNEGSKRDGKGKSSSGPVPPPRNKPKPNQPGPKGKSKK